MLFYIGRYTGIEFIIFFLAYLIVVIMSLTLHEFAHAFVAYKNGDSTPKMQGRISLNPLKHIDLIGIICCAFFGFGWAKPVEINPSNFRNVKKGTAWTSVAGVIVNLILAFLGYGIYSLLVKFAISNYFMLFLEILFYHMFFLNLCLCVFNLLPIYPLDGFKLVEVFTKYNNAYVQFMYKYGNIILIVFVVFFDNILIKLIELLSYPITWFWTFLIF